MRYLIACAVALALSACGHSGGGGGCGGGTHAPADPPPASQNYVYRCSMDGATRATPGPCPKCGMALGENDRVRQ